MNNLSLLTVIILLALTPSSSLYAEVFYYHTDNFGTPMAMTDKDGQVVWRADELPFGEEYETIENPVKNNIRYLGKEMDEETGLIYMGARFLDPKTGRFNRPDPVGLVDPFNHGKINMKLLYNPQLQNRYVYGQNNPYRYVDSDGREVTVLGSDSEKKVIKSWMNNIESSNSSKAKNRLEKVINSPKNINVKISDNLIRAGQFNPRSNTVELDRSLLNPNQKTFEYRTPLFSKYKQGYYGGTGTLTHELLGHGFDAISGNRGKNEQSAVNVANEVRDSLGKPRRGGMFDKK